MATLTVAGKASQASIFPAFLVATYANESDPNAKIGLHVEDVDKLLDGDGAVVELKYADSNDSIYDLDQIIQNLTNTYNLSAASGSQSAVSMVWHLC